jgi:CubicO group peptidase (beta-lactamase class C family)
VSGEHALPEQASLRYLKVTAKRRQAAGEFATLHDAQLAVARENGQQSWAALRTAVAAQQTAAGREGHALTQLRWIIGRFAAAGEPGWAAPGEAELREHFTEQFLTAVPPEALVARITGIGPALGAELVVISSTPLTAQARLGGHLLAAVCEPRPPYRLAVARESRLGDRISDPRAAPAPAVTSGPVPGPVPALAAAARERFGLVGLVLAGASRTPADPPWAAAAGWANLEDGQPLSPGHAFPAYQVTMVVTAVTVLCLAAAGRLRLDERANAYLSLVRLADDAVTVRELLAHTAGVAEPPALSAPAVPELAAVTGPVVACPGRRGTFGFSHTGYGVLGQIVAGRTGLGYAESAARLVLRPLGMDGSWFPSAWPGEPAGGVPAVTGYEIAADDTFRPAPGAVCVFPAAAGLWATADDLVRFGLGWASLLPRSLAEQAVRPHTTQPNGVHLGLGWIVNESAGLVGHTGDGPGGAASLLVSGGGEHACVALANRQVPVEPVNGAVLQVLGRARQD